jgi:hypothetical protein
MDQSTFTGQLVTGLIALGTIANFVVIWSQRNKAQPREISPQPLEVKPSAAYALASELKRVEHDLGGRIASVDADLKSLRGEIVANGETRRQSIEAKVEHVREELREDIQGVHRRVDDVLSAVSELKGEMKHT